MHPPPSLLLLSSFSSKFFFSLYTDCIKKVVQEEGVARGLFKGYVATVFAYLPFSCTWWTTYELTKQWLVFCTPFSSLLFPPEERSGGRMPTKEEKMDSPRVHLLSGMAAGFTAPVVSNPFDVIKTRKQVDTSGASFWKLLMDLLRMEGAKALYKGLTARWVLSSPMSAVAFVAYEKLKQWSEKHK